MKVLLCYICIRDFAQNYWVQLLVVILSHLVALEFFV